MAERASDRPAGGATIDAVDRAVGVLGARAQRQAPLGVLTTYRVGGPAAVGVVARDLDDLETVSAAAAASGLPVLVVGRGSNLLVADGGFGGIALTLDPAGDAFGFIEIDGMRLRAGAAVPLPALARRSADAGLTGLEWAVGVPGSVGGGVRMNAGGHGSDMAHTLLWVSLMDLDRSRPGHPPDHPGGVPGPVVPEVEVADLRFSYRSSGITDTQVVVSAEFRLGSGDPERGRATIRDIVRWRREHQPGGQNAGSIFTNPAADPPANSAGWLIEAAGLKGRRLGSAMVSPKHANFIQADPDGSADDVLHLLGAVQAEVAGIFGIQLRTEVRLIGFPPETQLSTSWGASS